MIKKHCVSNQNLKHDAFFVSKRTQNQTSLSIIVPIASLKQTSFHTIINLCLREQHNREKRRAQSFPKIY